MNEEEVARLVRTRARAWQGGRGSAKQSRWAQAGTRRRRWAWLPAVTALVSAAFFTAAAAAYARGPAPVRQVLAPVGDRVSLPWHSDSREDHTGTQVEKVQSVSSPGQHSSKPVGPAVVAPRELEHERAGSDHPDASPSPDDHGGDSSGRSSGAPAHRSGPTPSPETDSEHR